MSADTGSPRVDTSRSSRRGERPDEAGCRYGVAGASGSGKGGIGQGADEAVKYRGQGVIWGATA
jgi:hypothetical protein